MKGIISSIAEIEVDSISKRELSRIKKDCTRYSRDFHTGNMLEVRGYQMSLCQTRISTPVRYAKDTFPKATWDDRRVAPEASATFAGPEPRDDLFAGQTKLFINALKRIRERQLALICAPTGSGKTILGLYLFAKLGLRTVIVVDRISLAEQWLDEIEAFLGLAKEEVGFIGDGKDTSKGKDITLAVVNSLAAHHNSFKKKIGNDYGLAIWDECHKMSAPFFVRSTRVFNARYRVGLTATPERRDGCTDLVTNVFGIPYAPVGGDALPVDIWPFKFQIPTKSLLRIKAAGGSRGVVATVLADCPERNQAGANILHKGWRNGRHCLGLSDRIKQLRYVEDALLDFGVLAKDIGYFSGYRYIYDNGKMVKQTLSPSYRKEVADTCRIILATYKMAGDGINIPRLDFGIDLTPRASGKQGIGRIRRPYGDKKRATWFTFDDIGVPFLRKYTEKRLKDFANDAGVTIRGR